MKLRPPTAPQPVTAAVLVVGVGDTMAEVVSRPVIVVAVFAVQVFAGTAVVPVVIWMFAIPLPLPPVQAAPVLLRTPALVIWRQ